MTTSQELLEKIEELQAQRAEVRTAERKEEERKAAIITSQDLDLQLIPLRQEYREVLHQEEEARQRARIAEEDKATEHRSEEYSQRHRRDQERDRAWPAKVRETCFVEAINPLFKSWGLCQSFLNEQRQGHFCDCCQYGYQNKAWLRGLVHQEKTKEPAVFIATEFS